jgi:hypothetical protein
MPEDLRDLGHGSAMSNHIRCQTVPKQVSSAAASATNSGSDERPPHNMTNRRRTCQTDSGAPHSQEDFSRGTGATILAKIGSQGVADVT